MYEEDLLPVGDSSATEEVNLSGPEARNWLKGNESESALASNRFGTTDEALRFVNSLYRAGAKRVVVPSDTIDDDGVERYADALVVTLPADPQKRERVRNLCFEELAREGFDTDDIGDSDQIYLWWD
jgi:hypothetical protein